MKITFTGGGTGGHIFPIVAVAKELQQLAEEAGEEASRMEYTFIGPANRTTQGVLQEVGIDTKYAMGGKLRRYITPLSIAQNILDVFIKFPVGLVQAFFHLYVLAPDVIFSKGGYGSLPTVLTGRLLGIPVLMHESDVAPGLANRICARFSREVFLAFRETEDIARGKRLVVGTPIRSTIAEGDAEAGQEYFGLTGEKPVILVTGGSQGAERLNNTILNILQEWLADFELIHLTGSRQYDRISKEAELVLDDELKPYYHALGFLNEKQLADAYAACHFVISRAGASNIFEIAAVGKPSLLVPLPEAAQDHQRKNAYTYSEAGAAIVIEHANATPHFLLERIKYIFEHGDEYREMAQAASAFARPRAAHIIAEYVFVFLTGREVHKSHQ